MAMAIVQTETSAQAPGLAPLLTPHGRLRASPWLTTPGGGAMAACSSAARRAALPAVFGYWRELGSLFVTALCTTPDASEGRGQASLPTPPAEELLARPPPHPR